MRRRLRSIGIAFVALIAAVGGLALAIALAPFPALTPREGAPSVSVQGIFHVHAERSHDGFGTLEEAVGAAKSLGNRFLVLTEHNELHPERPRRIDGVLVIPGIEISSTHGHVIAVDLDHDPKEKGPEVLRAIREAGGEAVLAHPVNRKRAWADPSPDGFAGFEGLSLDSALRTSLATEWGRIAMAGVALVGDRRKAGALLVGRPEDALARYDELTARRSVAMLCGADAHGRPPYVTSFAALAQHVELSPGVLAAWGRSADADAAAVIQAIRAARTFCSIPAFGDAGSFRFEASSEEVSVEVALDEAILLLFRDGAEVARSRGPRLAHPGGPGVWRSEVHVDPGFPYRSGQLWISSSARWVR